MTSIANQTRESGRTYGRTPPAKPARMGRRRTRRAAKGRRGASRAQGPSQNQGAQYLTPNILAKLNCARIICGFETTREERCHRKIQRVLSSTVEDMKTLLGYWKRHGFVQPVKIDRFLAQYNSPGTEGYAGLIAVATELRKEAQASATLLATHDHVGRSDTRIECYADLIVGFGFANGGRSGMQDIVSRVRKAFAPGTNNGSLHTCFAAPWNSFVAETRPTKSEAALSLQPTTRGISHRSSSGLGDWWSSRPFELKFVLAGIIVPLAALGAVLLIKHLLF